MSRITTEKQRKVNRIKAALGASDKGVYEHFSSLDAFETSAQKGSTGQVNAAWIATLGKLRDDILAARDRLFGLHTGLRAEAALAKALTQAAAGVAAWQFALQVDDPKETQAALLRMKTHFIIAEQHGKAGANYLKQGK